MMALGSAPGRAGLRDRAPFGRASQVPAVASCGVEECGIDDGAEGGGRAHIGVCGLEPRHLAWKVSRMEGILSFLPQPSRQEQ